MAVGLSGGSRAHVEVSPNSVAVIDERSDNVVGAVGVGARPGGIAFGSGSVWVANADDQTVSRIDPTSLRTVRTLPVGGTPTGIAASRGAIWVTESDPTASSVSVSARRPRVQLTRTRGADRERRPGRAGRDRRARQRGLGRPVLRAAYAP